MSVTSFYADWAGYNRRITRALRGMSEDDLALRVADEKQWPIWAVAGHTAGMRVYWLCAVLGEPGAETTPFRDPAGYGWEDDLDTPRSAEELGAAFDTTWRIIESSLQRWPPAMLDETIERVRGSSRQRHSRQSVLMRLINHEAYHAGEISLTLGANGREPIDLWPQEDWEIGPAATEG